MRRRRGVGRCGDISICARARETEIEGVGIRTTAWPSKNHLGPKSPRQRGARSPPRWGEGGCVGREQSRAESTAPHRTTRCSCRRRAGPYRLRTARRNNTAAAGPRVEPSAARARPHASRRTVVDEERDGNEEAWRAGKNQRRFLLHGRRLRDGQQLTRGLDSQRASARDPRRGTRRAMIYIRRDPSRTRRRRRMRQGSAHRQAQLAPFGWPCAGAACSCGRAYGRPPSPHRSEISPPEEIGRAGTPDMTPPAARAHARRVRARAPTPRPRRPGLGVPGGRPHAVSRIIMTLCPGRCRCCCCCWCAG